MLNGAIFLNRDNDSVVAHIEDGVDQFDAKDVHNLLAPTLHSVAKAFEIKISDLRLDSLTYTFKKPPSSIGS